MSNSERERERERETKFYCRFYCRGTNHFNQCDLPFVAPKTLMRFGLKESDLDSARAHQINMEICHAFLKRYLLKGTLCFGVLCFSIYGKWDTYSDQSDC